MTPAEMHALIVEDDRAWQQILAEILADAGLAVDVAGDLEMAVHHLRSAPHRLALVDLSLVGSDPHNQDGLLVLEAARRYDPGCVTILLTGYATVDLAVNALTEHGAFTCLHKESFNRAQFRDLIGRALARPPAWIGAPSLEEPPGGASEAPGQSGLALLVEDDSGWRSILAELLGDAGYLVRACAGLGEALGCLRRESYALAVVDLSLLGSAAAWERAPEQELGGYRLLVSARAAGIPTIVVSGMAAPDDIERTYTQYGVFAYLEKQAFDRAAFLRAVSEARAASLGGSELELLTGREREVLDLLAQGMTNKEIAQALVISTNTVKRHLKAIFEKLDIHTRSAAAAKAVGG
ncbi:MAG: response regulator [Thermoflexales bacterium]|nr:response regulator [Thermoflexales bacterium]